MEQNGVSYQALLHEAIKLRRHPLGCVPRHANQFGHLHIGDNQKIFCNAMGTYYLGNRQIAVVSVHRTDPGDKTLTRFGKYCSSAYRAFHITDGTSMTDSVSPSHTWTYRHDGLLACGGLAEDVSSREQTNILGPTSERKWIGGGKGRGVGNSANFILAGSHLLGGFVLVVRD
jgi:hypothetical protein